jgi:hypothetical protein
MRTTTPLVPYLALQLPVAFSHDLLALLLESLGHLPHPFIGSSMLDGSNASEADVLAQKFDVI